VNGPARRVEEAAEAIRALNYATLPGAGELMFPADAYETAGVLAVLAARLPQALAQLSAFLQEQVVSGDGVCTWFGSVRCACSGRAWW
jgi:hypothetical protein